MISAVRFAPTRRLEAVGLNPQPLPPRFRNPFSSQGPLTPRMWSHLDSVTLNPQPLPPRASSRYEKVALNPQPLPPKVFAEIALNPQPLPPRDFPISAFTAKMLSVIR